MENSSNITNENKVDNTKADNTKVDNTIVDNTKVDNTKVDNTKVEKTDAKKPNNNNNNNNNNKPNQERKPRQPKEKKEKQEPKKNEKKPEAGGDKEQNLLGLTVTKSGNFGSWYKQLIQKAEMIEYYDISGCYILRPWSFRMWEQIQQSFDKKIKDDGVENAYFPLLVSQKRLESEEKHIEGFAPEVAWITQAGQSKLAQPVAVRPTSETIMYPAYSLWIRSHRDLPLRLNQWCNVLRWEFKHPVPFLRSREFLWQEGHSAFATKNEADKEVHTILEFYKQVFEDLLAVPVVKGFKSEGEKFAGGLYTTSCEAFIPTNGRGIQGATSHCLGQNFSKMFDIKFEDEKRETQFAWQNSWGITTRTIGIMTMVHGDDKGLVLPPRVAPIQVVFVPISFKNKPTPVEVVDKSNEIVKNLKARGLRVHMDDRPNYQFGWKFNFWELKGVPIRLEFGPKDLQSGHIFLYRRDKNTKEKVSLEEVCDKVASLLDVIHTDMLDTARALRDSKIIKITEWSSFVSTLDKGCLVKAPWCEQTLCEEQVGKKSGAEAKALADAKKSEASEEDDEFRLTSSAKTLCIPLQQDEIPEGTKCFACEEKAKRWTLFGRSY